MVRNAALWMLFCVPMYWQVPAGADEPKTADEVIAKYIEAIGGREKIDAANRDDPRTELVDGKPQSRELLFAQRVYEWVRKLVDHPSEELLLAARAHTLRRWLIPRDRYPIKLGDRERELVRRAKLSANAGSHSG